MGLGPPSAARRWGGGKSLMLAGVPSTLGCRRAPGVVIGLVWWARRLGWRSRGE